ncbi:MAG: hypothetical protein R2754_09650 [Microthrixaceae bacterium]
MRSSLSPGTRLRLGGWAALGLDCFNSWLDALVTQRAAEGKVPMTWFELLEQANGFAPRRPPCR